MIESDREAAVELEQRINRFMQFHVVPLAKKEGLSNAALDKLMAAAGSWCPLSANLLWPHHSDPYLAFILVIFRWMHQSAAITRHAIVVGYFTSALAGALLFDVDWKLSSQGWFWPAAVEGVAFYIVFRMMALTTQIAGITVASIATKMSVVIPTLIGILALGESVNFLKISGLIFGVLAVLLAAGARISLVNWLLPLLVFLCTGLIDASFKLFQLWGLTDDQFPGFVITIFGFAFIAASIHHLIQPNRTINRVSAGSGILLGLANLGTVYFLLKALAQPGWESSIVFPLNNFGAVFVSTITAILVLGERPTTSTTFSLIAVTISIALLYAAT